MSFPQTALEIMGLHMLNLLMKRCFRVIIFHVHTSSSCYKQIGYLKVPFSGRQVKCGDRVTFDTVHVCAIVKAQFGSLDVVIPSDQMQNCVTLQVLSSYKFLLIGINISVSGCIKRIIAYIETENKTDAQQTIKTSQTLNSSNQ